MSLYFFDVHDGAQHVRDEFGSDLQSIEEVEKVAMGILSDLARTLFRQAIRQDIIIDVRNQVGQYIYTINLLVVPRQLG